MDACEAGGEIDWLILVSERPGDSRFKSPRARSLRCVGQKADNLASARLAVTISERALGYLAVASVTTLALLSLVFAIMAKEPSFFSAGPAPSGPLTNPFPLALAAAILVAVLLPLFRLFVKMNLRSWKVMDGRAKSHFISDQLWWGLVAIPSLAASFTTWFLVSGRMLGLLAVVASVIVAVVVGFLMLFPFTVLMAEVHERYNVTTLDSLVPLDYRSSRASFKILYKKIFGYAYRRLKKPK